MELIDKNSLAELEFLRILIHRFGVDKYDLDTGNVLMRDGVGLVPHKIQPRDDMVSTFVLEEGEFRPKWWRELMDSKDFIYIPRHETRKGYYQYHDEKVPLGSRISRAPDGTIHIQPES